MPAGPDDEATQRGTGRLASAERALGKVDTGLQLVDKLLKLGEGAGLPLIPAVCSAARDVLKAVQASRSVINDALSAAQRTIDVLELLQLMAKNVERMDGCASVEDRMRELQRLLEDVRSAVAAFGKKGWLRHALKVGTRSTLSQLDSEITGQLDLLLKFYSLARDADIIDRLQAREYPVEAEVERQVAERKALGEAVDAEALEKDCEVVRGIAVASGVSDAEFQQELTREMRKGFAQQGLKLDKVLEQNQKILEQLSLGSVAAQPHRMSLYAYDRKPDAPPGQKDKLAARLGKGSFGVTYRMRKVAGIDARRYAVKMIETEEVDGAGLEKEARVLSMIEHENTLRYYDAFWHDTDDSRLFVIVTELLTGGSLAEKIAAAPPPPPPEVAALMRQVASGLAYMHSLNLQHRDLKPANVMLDSAGRAKIIDFGLACVSSASHRSRTKTKVGTNAYMSPEKTAEKRYGPADDVWAAGCILAELLLGRTIGNVALDAAKRQRAIAEGKSASQQLGSWVEGCLKVSPGRRPAAAVLEQGLASGGSGAHEAEERSRREAAAATVAADEKERVHREAVDRSREAEEARARQEALGGSAAAERAAPERATAERAAAAERVEEEKAAAEMDRRLREAEEQRAHRDAADRSEAEVERARQEATAEVSTSSDEAREISCLCQWVSFVPACLVVSIAAVGCTAPLVALARGGTNREKEQATRELINLEHVPSLVDLARGGTEWQKLAAAGALRNLAFNNVDNRVAIARAGGIAPLVALARGGTEKQEERAASALRYLAYNDDNNLAIAMEQLRSGGDEQKEEAARALGSLAWIANNKVAIAKAGGIAPLVALARGGTDGQKKQAVTALGILADNADNRVAIAKAGGIAPLVALVRGGTDGQEEWAARALLNLAANNSDNQAAITKAGGIAPLVALARSGTDEQKWRAGAAALAVFAWNADNKVAIAMAGGIAPLVALARDGTDRQKECAARALENLGCTKSMFGWKTPKALRR